MPIYGISGSTALETPMVAAGGHIIPNTVVLFPEDAKVIPNRDTAYLVDVFWYFCSVGLASLLTEMHRAWTFLAPCMEALASYLGRASGSDKRSIRAKLCPLLGDDLRQS
jgi:hypothetical protein